MFEQVVGVDDDRVLPQRLGDEAKQLEQLLEPDLAGVEMVPTCEAK